MSLVWLLTNMPSPTKRRQSLFHHEPGLVAYQMAFPYEKPSNSISSWAWLGCLPKCLPLSVLFLIFLPFPFAMFVFSFGCVTFPVRERLIYVFFVVCSGYLPIYLYQSAYVIVYFQVRFMFFSFHSSFFSICHMCTFLSISSAFRMQISSLPPIRLLLFLSSLTDCFPLFCSLCV